MAEDFALLQAELTRRAGRIGGQIIEAIRGIRFGSVEIVIHDGEVVQIERREKLRFEQPRKDRP